MKFWENSISYLDKYFFICNNKIWFFPKEKMKKEDNDRNSNKYKYEKKSTVFQNKIKNNRAYYPIFKVSYNKIGK